MKKYQILRSFLALILMAVFAIAIKQIAYEIPREESCSTFLFENGDSRLVGHNLDEYIDVPGLVVVNPRNISKQSISWSDLKSIFGRGEPQLHWVSKFASITYNTFGKEFIDGGMNETGFYVGEMNLANTKYPDEKNLVSLYHHLWMQYLLDNYATVKEALWSLSSVVPDGHCTWHFFMAESSGNAAVVEFIDGKTVVYTDSSLPYKILCNDLYDAELKDIVNYNGFGGAKNGEPRYEREDPRFRWGLLMMRNRDSSSSPVNYAFSILHRLDVGNNKWSIVYDLKNLKMYFNTYNSRNIRFVDIHQFDLSGDSSAMVLDINRDYSGNVADRFLPYSVDIQCQYVKEAWDHIDAGFFGNLFFKPIMVSRLSSYTKDFKKR